MISSPLFLPAGLALVFGSLSAAILAWALATLALEKVSLPDLRREAVVSPGPMGKKDLVVLRVFLTYFLLCGLILLYEFPLGLLMLLLGGAGYGVLRLWPQWRVKSQGEKKQKKMQEIFPQTLGMAIQALKTGQTIPQVVEYLSRESPSPLKDEFAQIGSEIDLGVSAEQALSHMADRYPKFQDFHQFVESYRISRHTGANLSHLLQVLLEGMEEKNKILRRMEAMTAQARLSGLLMGVLPFILALVFFIMDPSLLVPLVTEPLGWGILGTAFFLETIGFLVIRQMLQLEI